MVVWDILSNVCLICGHFFFKFYATYEADHFFTGDWENILLISSAIIKSQIWFISLSVREITNSSSTFSATNISNNMIWLLQLHDTIQMTSNYTWLNYTHNDIAIRRHIRIYNSVPNLIFATKFSSIYLAKGEKRLVFRLSFVNLQGAKDGTHVFDAKYRYVFVV